MIGKFQLECHCTTLVNVLKYFVTYLIFRGVVHALRFVYGTDIQPGISWKQATSMNEMSIPVNSVQHSEH